jgi:hypothetical protein
VYGAPASEGLTLPEDRLGLQTALDDIPARPSPDEPDLRAFKAKVFIEKQT